MFTNYKLLKDQYKMLIICNWDLGRYIKKIGSQIYLKIPKIWIWKEKLLGKGNIGNEHTIFSELPCICHREIIEIILFYYIYLHKVILYVYISLWYEVKSRFIINNITVLSTTRRLLTSHFPRNWKKILKNSSYIIYHVWRNLLANIIWLCNNAVILLELYSRWTIQ